VVAVHTTTSSSEKSYVAEFLARASSTSTTGYGLDEKPLTARREIE